MRDSNDQESFGKDRAEGRDGANLSRVGKTSSDALWRDEAPQGDEPPSRRDYETVGYVIAGTGRTQP